MLSLHSRPTLPPSKQAPSSLLKKAVAAAHMSVSRLVPSSTYDPASPPLPIRTHSYEEKQQQKELLLQQHRELQLQLVRQQQERDTEEKKKEEVKREKPREEGQDQASSTQETDTVTKTKAGPEVGGIYSIHIGENS